MPELTDEVHKQIKALCKQAQHLAQQGDYVGAEEFLWGAWDLLPEPQTEWEAATFILGSVGDMNFLAGKFEAGRDNLSSVMNCPDAIGNPFLHFRLAQCEYELGDRHNSAQEFARAYMGSGAELFRDADPKYYDFLKSSLATPTDGWEEL